MPNFRPPNRQGRPSPNRRPGLNPRRLLAEGLDVLLNYVFAINLLGGILRFVVIVMGGLFIWIAVSIHTHPISPWILQNAGDSLKEVFTFFLDNDPIYRLLAGGVKSAIYCSVAGLSTISAMFNADILRHVVAIGVPIFLALRTASLYLKDLYELERERTAIRFIIQAAFALRYHRIVIENGRVSPKDQEKPLYRIGGPGLVQVNLENLAVFEQIDGEPHVIPPTTRRGPLFPYAEVLDSFERLRDVIDLRDQIVTDRALEVDGRTRDGIPVKARNIRYLFSVLRNEEQAQPGQLTYDREGILTLVYKRGTGTWHDGMKGSIRRSIHTFIAEHNLSEFLAATGEPEVREQGQLETSLERESNQLSPDPTLRVPIPRTLTPPPNFVARPRITENFINSVPVFGSANGLQLHWIDVGTWVTPSAIIPERHREAWQITCDNEIRRRRLEQTRASSRAEELIRLVSDTPLKAFRLARAQGKPDKVIWAVIMEAYLGLLRSARDSYSEQNQPIPADLVASINFLGRFINDYLINEGLADFI